MTPSLIQPKLTVSQPGDPYEQEADRVADQVMRMPAPVGQIGNQGAPAFLQGPVRVASEAEERKASTLARGGPVAALSRPIRNTAAPEGVVPGAGEPLPASLRSELEASIGQRLDEIRVHRDESSAALVAVLGARAYAVGSHLVFGRGEWAPHSRAGRDLIAHEVVHVRAPLVPGQIALQKKGDVEPPLDINVPQPGSGETYQPAAKYPWQNPALQESIYPYREEMLSFFLQIYREIELLKDPSQALDPVADEIRKGRARQPGVGGITKEGRCIWGSSLGFCIFIKETGLCVTGIMIFLWGLW